MASVLELAVLSEMAYDATKATHGNWVRQGKIRWGLHLVQVFIANIIITPRKEMLC